MWWAEECPMHVKNLSAVVRSDEEGNFHGAVEDVAPCGKLRIMRCRTAKTRATTKHTKQRF